MSGKHLIASQAGQLHGEVKTQDVTISGTWPTELPVDILQGRKDFLLYNGTGVDIWVGGLDVTQYTGIPVIDGSSFNSQLGRAQLYGITASATVSGVRIMEIA